MRIANPTKSVTIDADIEHVKRCVKQLHKIYVDIDMESEETNEDDLMGIYTYRIRELGVNFGVRAVISLSQEIKGQTKIDIEMQRIVGSYDMGSEVQLANQHMLTILQSLSKLLKKSEEELANFTPQEQEKVSNEGGTFFYVTFFIAAIVVSILFLSKCQ